MTTLTITPVSDDSGPIAFDQSKGQSQPKGYNGSAFQRLGSDTIGGQRTGKRGDQSQIIGIKYSNSIADLKAIQDSAHLQSRGFADFTTADTFITGTHYIHQVASTIQGGKRSWNGVTYSYSLTVTFTAERV